MREDADIAGLAPPVPLAGAALIADEVKRLPGRPGVYRMLGAAGEVLYVGKARSLKARVSSYAKSGGHSNRILRMISETRGMEFVVTETETEALLLEANLIKQLKPRYNVLFRDDKSFPFILIAEHRAAPQLLKHRGARKRAGAYYGPFASAGAVNRTLNTLEKAFLLRSCPDSVYESRTRPCLLHQIKRCSAPCVGLIDEAAYRKLVEEAKAFLAGDNAAVQQGLSKEMDEASEGLDFERAAHLRDRIRALTYVQGSQDINAAGITEADVFAIHAEGGQASIQVFFFRAGQNWGNHAFFPKHDREINAPEIVDAFLAQFYDGREPPSLILVNVEPPQAALLSEALSLRAGRKVSVHCPRRGEKRAIVEAAAMNAREALSRRMAESASQLKNLDRLAEVLGLPAPPRRIEVYDNSHIQGTNAVGAMIVAGPEGFIKNQYRKFNIKSADLERRTKKWNPAVAGRSRFDPPSRAKSYGRRRPVFRMTGATAKDSIASGDPDLPPDAIAAGDDYAMMREVLTRRFARLRRDEDAAARAAANRPSPFVTPPPLHPEEDRRSVTKDEGAEALRVKADLQGEPPDLVVIDGGAGQLKIAIEVMREAGFDPGAEGPALIAVAKGRREDEKGARRADRTAGAIGEQIFIPGRAPFLLPPREPALFFLQRLRDEAHRFAIGAHRAKRKKAIGANPLDDIQGVGAARKRALLHHFGSAKAVARAKPEDLTAVEGVSAALAQRIYDFFHGG